MYIYIYRERERGLAKSQTLFRGEYMSDTNCLTHAFFKRGE